MHAQKVPAKVLGSLRLGRIESGERFERFTIESGEDGALYLKTSAIRLLGIGLLGVLGIAFGLFMAGCLVYALLIGQSVNPKGTVCVVLPLLLGPAAIYFSAGVTRVRFDPQAGEIDYRWLYGLSRMRTSGDALSGVVFRIRADGNARFCRIEFRGENASAFFVGDGTNTRHEDEAVTMVQVACWAARELKIPLMVESDRELEEALEEDSPLGKYLQRLLPELSPPE